MIPIARALSAGWQQAYRYGVTVGEGAELARLAKVGKKTE
jgi:hypothetical protein